jgi:predicted DsbA family dithiol-disulfide isomerase
MRKSICNLSRSIRAAAEGEDANERQMGKYGISEEQLEARRAVIHERAAAFGIAFNTHRAAASVAPSMRTACCIGPSCKTALALALKRILQRAYFSDDENISNHEVLVRLAREAGLDADAARRVLEGGEYADAVRTQERHFQQAGVHSVPTIIINGQHLISGGQPPEVFEQALRHCGRERGLRPDRPSSPATRRPPFDPELVTTLEKLTAVEPRGVAAGAGHQAPALRGRRQAPSTTPPVVP